MKITIFNCHETSRVIREEHATLKDFDNLCAWLTAQGFTVHRSLGAEGNPDTVAMAAIEHADPAFAATCGLLELSGAAAIENLPTYQYRAETPDIREVTSSDPIVETHEPLQEPDVVVEPREPADVLHRDQPGVPRAEERGDDRDHVTQSGAVATGRGASAAGVPPAFDFSDFLN